MEYRQRIGFWVLFFLSGRLALGTCDSRLVLECNQLPHILGIHPTLSVLKKPGRKTVVSSQITASNLASLFQTRLEVGWQTKGLVVLLPPFTTPMALTWRAGEIEYKNDFHHGDALNEIGHRFETAFDLPLKDPQDDQVLAISLVFFCNPERTQVLGLRVQDVFGGTRLFSEDRIARLSANEKRRLGETLAKMIGQAVKLVSPEVRRFRRIEWFGFPKFSRAGVSIELPGYELFG